MKNAGEEQGMRTTYTITFNFFHIWLEMSVDNSLFTALCSYRVEASGRRESLMLRVWLHNVWCAKASIILFSQDFSQFIINTMSVWFSNNNPKGEKKQTTFLTQTTAFYPFTIHLCSMFQWKKL